MVNSASFRAVTRDEYIRCRLPPQIKFKKQRNHYKTNSLKLWLFFEVEFFADFTQRVAKSSRKSGPGHHGWTANSCRYPDEKNCTATTGEQRKFHWQDVATGARRRRFFPFGGEHSRPDPAKQLQPYYKYYTRGILLRTTIIYVVNWWRNVTQR